MIEIKIKQFEGPLDLLLQLIEQHQLDISTVALADVTDQYLGTLERVERLHPDELADFLVVAAKLLLIKSRILLPQLDFPAEEGLSLADQLKLYQTFVGAADNIRRIFHRRRVMYGREHPALLEPMFSPPVSFSPDDLHQMFQRVVSSLQPLMIVSETTISRALSLQEKIQAVREAIRQRTVLSFRELLASATSRMDVIVTFLALLELVKQRTAAVVQDRNFEEIQIAQALESGAAPLNSETPSV
ncbi:MAG: segregation/condensation protein A [Candidatus Kerfeldbacteria bacterium]|nr:segregation/condensation protein A [Candidatus Kerfeldbacteria bacterium]